MHKLATIPKTASALGAAGLAGLRALGAQLRHARTGRGMSRDALGERILVSRATLQRLEAGDPRVAIGYYIAAGGVLGVTVLAAEGPLAIAESRLLPPRSRAARKRASDQWFG